MLDDNKQIVKIPNVFWYRLVEIGSEFISQYCISDNHNKTAEILYLFHDRGPCHIETSPLICRVNQWTGFYMIGTSIMKKMNDLANSSLNIGIK